MVEFSNDLFGLIDKVKFIELESTWMRSIDSLGYIIRTLASVAPVYVIIYGSRKYVDTYEMYVALEPYIACYENIIVFWEYNVESIFYHVSRLNSVDRGYVIIILPYDRSMVSQIENTMLVSLSRVVNKVLEKGWRIIVVNPVTSGEGVFSTFITPFTYRVEFIGKKFILKPLIPLPGRSITRFHYSIFK